MVSKCIYYPIKCKYNNVYINDTIKLLYTVCNNKLSYSRKQTLEKTVGTIKNGQSRDTGNCGHTGQTTGSE